MNSYLVFRGSNVRRQDRLERRPGPFLLQNADGLGGLAILDMYKSENLSSLCSKHCM